jgi:hypothetical protein
LRGEGSEESAEEQGAAHGLRIMGGLFAAGYGLCGGVVSAALKLWLGGHRSMRDSSTARRKATPLGMTPSKGATEDGIQTGS